MHYVQNVYGIGIFIRILQLFTITHCQCPEYFRYFRNETTGEIMGTVEIPMPPQGVPLHLRVVLSVATVLPTKYVGRLELAKSREESIREILQGMPLYYKIYFPVRNPIPTVISITLNDRQYCFGQPAVGVIVTNIILEHSLFPPRVIIPLTEQLLDFISNKTTTSTTTVHLELPTKLYMADEKQIVTTPPTNFQKITKPTVKKDKADFSCGLAPEPNSITAIDNSTSPTMWPWLAAIFVMKEDLEFQCQGNLVSKLYILTAAHCLKEREENIPTDLMIVSLGRFNLRNWKEPHSLNLQVAEYKFHPKFKNSRTADFDLAIVKVIKHDDYPPNIRPICLWMGRFDLNEYVGKFGYALGWRKDKVNRRYSNEPWISKVSIVSQEECHQSRPEYIEIMSNQTFCASKRDGNPSNNVEGSGLIMYHNRYGRYHLRGITSLSILGIPTETYDFQEYTVYVDIAKYLSWIRHEIMFL